MILNLLYVLLIAIAIVAIMLFIVFLYKKNTIPVTTVKAGPIQNIHAFSGNIKTSISPFDSFYHEGKKVNPRDYIVCKVDGDCMTPRGINACDLVFIKEFKADNEKDIIKKGDIIYIKYLKDDYEGYKIREVDERLDDKLVKTLYYSAEGVIKHSSNPHKLENIIGIVKMKFKN